MGEPNEGNTAVIDQGGGQEPSSEIPEQDDLPGGDLETEVEDDLNEPGETDDNQEPDFDAEMEQLRQENEKFQDILTELMASKKTQQKELVTEHPPAQTTEHPPAKGEIKLRNFLTPDVLNSYLDGDPEPYVAALEKYDQQMRARERAERVKWQEEFMTTVAKMMPDMVERKTTFDAFVENNKHLFDTVEKKEEALNTIEFLTESAPNLPYVQILNLTATLLGRKYRPAGTVAKPNEAAAKGVQKPAGFAKAPNASNPKRQSRKGGFIHDYKESYKKLR